jgi:type 1 glutamine amidotransferase
MKVKGSTAPLLAAVCTAALLAAGVGMEAQAPAAGAQPAAAPARGRGGRGGAGEACGGRSANPKEACASDVARMKATVGVIPAKPPATPQKPRKVLLFSRIPSAGFQHSSIPLAMDTIAELGTHTGAWTSDKAWDASVFTPENLKQYDAIFLSSTTGCFLDDPNDQATTDARRQALLDFVRNGKGIAGIHATGDSYHGTSCGGGGAARAGAAGRAGRAGRAGGRAGGNAARGGRAAFTPPPPCSHRNNSPNGGGQGLWPAWNQLIGGYFKFHWVYPSPITVKIDDPSNPINAPFKGQAFDTIDEVYTFAQDSWSRKNVHVLTSIDYSQMTDCQKGLEEYPRTDHDFGLSWIRREGQGRVFYEALGHSETIYYNNPAMLEHLLAGMQYVLGDLKADDSPSQK